MYHNGLQNAMLGVAWGLLGCAIFFIFARVLVRTRIQPGTYGCDDWAMITGAILSAGCSVTSTLAIECGLGRYFQDVDPGQRAQANQLIIIWSMLSFVGILFVKVSVCIFLLRLVSRTNRTRKIVRWLVAINMTVTVPATLAMCAVGIAQLIPVSSSNVLGSKRFSSHTVTVLFKVISATVGVCTDFMTASIPIVLVCRLQMPKAQRMQACAVLALGFLVGAISIVKTANLNWTAENWTRSGAIVVFWGTIELNCGIIVACLPTLRPVVHYIKVHIGGSEDIDNNQIENVDRRINVDYGFGKRALGGAESRPSNSVCSSIEDEILHHGNEDLSEAENESPGHRRVSKANMWISEQKATSDGN